MAFHILKTIPMSAQPQYELQNLDFARNILNQYPLPEIQDFLKKIAHLKILVVGEPIIDSYVFCQPSGISSKSPTVSAQYIRQEDYAGGSLALANHLAFLGAQVSLLIPWGDDKHLQKFIQEKLDPSIDLHTFLTPGFPTPQKTRYLIPFQNQRVFELINIKDDQWHHIDAQPFCEKLNQHSRGKDLTLIADFGHGLFEDKVLDTTAQLSTPIALNVQTNSGNHGYNYFTKHKKFDYLSIDERECRLGFSDRYSEVKDLARKAFDDSHAKAVSVTLGTQGSLYVDDSDTHRQCPTFFGKVNDTTGAGDAYFAMTAALQQLAAPKDLLLFLGNCYAGLYAQITGNKRSVTPQEFLDFLQSMEKL